MATSNGNDGGDHHNVPPLIPKDKRYSSGSGRRSSEQGDNDCVDDDGLRSIQPPKRQSESTEDDDMGSPKPPGRPTLSTLSPHPRQPSTSTITQQHGTPSTPSISLNSEDKNTATSTLFSTPTLKVDEEDIVSEKVPPHTTSPSHYHHNQSSLIKERDHVAHYSVSPRGSSKKVVMHPSHTAATQDEEDDDGSSSPLQLPALDHTKPPPSPVSSSTSSPSHRIRISPRTEDTENATKGEKEDGEEKTATDLPTLPTLQTTAVIAASTTGPDLTDYQNNEARTPISTREEIPIAGGDNETSSQDDFFPSFMDDDGTSFRIGKGGEDDSATAETTKLERGTTSGGPEFMMDDDVADAAPSTLQQETSGPEFMTDDDIENTGNSSPRRSLNLSSVPENDDEKEAAKKERERAVNQQPPMQSTVRPGAVAVTPATDAGDDESRRRDEITNAKIAAAMSTSAAAASAAGNSSSSSDTATSRPGVVTAALGVGNGADDTRRDEITNAKIAAAISTSAAAARPGAVAVGGMNESVNNNSTPSLDAVSASSNPGAVSVSSAPSVNSKGNRLELAAPTADGTRMSIAPQQDPPNNPVFVSSHQQTRMDGPEPTPGSVTHVQSMNDGPKPIKAEGVSDIEEGMNNNMNSVNDVSDPNAIKAELVPDEDDVADRIAERVRAQMEEQFSQQRREEEERRAREGVVMAVKMEESDLASASKASTSAHNTQHLGGSITSAGAPGGDDDDDKEGGKCWFGLSRAVIIGGIVGFLVLFGAVAAIVAIVTKPDEPSTSAPLVKGTQPPTTQSPTTASPSQAPTATPTEWLEGVGVSARFETLLSLLEPIINPSSLSPLEFLRDTEAPQFKALAWMADEDSIGLPFEERIVNTLVERYVLMVLFFNNGRASFLEDLGFKSAQSVCSWYDEDLLIGISCEGPWVSRIELPRSDLQGTLPSELGLMTSLLFMDFDDNYFVGSLPTEVSKLSDLTNLWIWNSGLTGQIPTEIGNMSSLYSWDLRDNAITGPLPSEIGALFGVSEILVSNNLLTGTLPTELGLLPEIGYLGVSDNLLEGEIPTEFGGMQFLTSLYLNSNRLTGSLPPELGNLNALETFWLYKNDLSGTVPDDFQNLVQLTNLGFWDTDITGNVDPIFCDGFRMNPWDELYADCREPNPEVFCSCCTHCCNDAGCIVNVCPLDEAIPITLNPNGVASISGSTIGATATIPTDGACDIGDEASPTQWYMLEVDSSTTLAVTTCSLDTTFDTVVSVFQGTPGEACGYICIGGNDDHGLDHPVCESSTFQSAHFFTAEPFQTYFIAVAGYDSTESGEFELKVLGQDLNEDGLNGDCPLDTATPVVFDPAGVVLSGSTAGASEHLPGSGLCALGFESSPALWYRLETGVAASVIATTCSSGTTFDTVIRVFQGSPEGECGFNCIGGNDDHEFQNMTLCDPSILHSAVSFNASAFESYYIVVSGFDSTAFGSFDLSILFAVRDVFDGDCPLAAAVPIDYDPSGVVFVSGSTVGSAAPSSSFDGSCNVGLGDSPTVWYKLEPDVAASIVATTCSPTTTFDTAISVFQGTTGGACDFMCVGGNDDNVLADLAAICSSSSLHSSVAFDTVAFQTYYIAVSGFSSTSTGQFDLSLIFSDSANNDVPNGGDCPLSSAIPIDYDPEGIIISGSTSSASANLPSTGSCNKDGVESPTVWYRLEPSFAGQLALTTCTADLVENTAFDTVITVFQETQECEFICIAENDDHGFGGEATFCDNDIQSVLFFGAEAFQTYFIAVSGSSPSDFGEFALFVLPLDDP